MRAAVSATCFMLAAIAAACAPHAAGSTASAEDDSTSLATRDFDAHPAILEIDDADEIFALSDPHGGIVELGELLEANGLLSRPAGSDDAASVRWSGGTATLVVAGDLIDKGPSSLGVIDLLRALESQAPASGGRVVVTLGNHEVEFFADPHNDKATSRDEDSLGIDVELETRRIDPDALAHGRDRAGRGAWLVNLPFGVRVKKWFFSHAGNTDGETISELERRLRKAFGKERWRAKDIAGPDSIVEAENWYGDPDDGDAEGTAAALGAKHIVFGHDPGALGDRGRILANHAVTLVKLNVSMGLDIDGAVRGGLLLHVWTRGEDRWEVLDSKGRSSPLPTTR